MKKSILLLLISVSVFGQRVGLINKDTTTLPRPKMVAIAEKDSSLQLLFSNGKLIRVANYDEIKAKVFDNVNAIRLKSGKSGEKATILGYTTKGDGGGQEVYWDATSTEPDNGGTIFQVTGVSTGRWKSSIKNRVDVRQFGARGDFNPLNNTGNDDTQAIQKAFDSMRNGGKVTFSAGDYYTNGITKSGNTTIAIDYTNNLIVEGDKATIYQGTYSARVLGIFNSTQVTISNLRIIGNTYAAGSGNTENRSGITINYNSRNITIDNCYISNSLGDCIYAGGSLVDGGQIGYTTKNIIIKNCTLKERYGNGVRSYNNGSQSRLAIAIIDCENVTITKNLIYGGIDLEPNLNNQNLKNILITGNEFKSGFVQPQATIGTLYNYDEPIGAESDADAVAIVQGVFCTGVPGLPNVQNIVVEHNNIEFGYFYMGNIYSFDAIGNKFYRGKIIVGSTSGSNTTSNVIIQNNSTVLPFDGDNIFIKVAGNLYFCDISGNKCSIPSGFCIHNAGVSSTGDGGRNFFANNTNRSATATGSIGFVVASSSIAQGNWHNTSSADEKTRIERVVIKEIRQDLISVVLTSTNQTIDYKAIGGNKWFLSGNNYSLGRVNNIPDGTTLTIYSNGNSATPTYLLYNSSYIRTVNFQNVTLLSTNQMITFEARAGILFERSRSFTPALFVQSAYNPPSITTGTQTTTTVTVSGAGLGDAVSVAFGLSLQGIIMTGYVSSTNTVTIVMLNMTGESLDLASDYLIINVTKKFF